jgi:mannose-6-phosphate isomerase-like protein (cupin superfamily)
MNAQHGPLESVACAHECVHELCGLEPGICLTIPLDTHFQFRAFGEAPLAVLGITMPPWPGADEATIVAGPWTPTGG